MHRPDLPLVPGNVGNLPLLGFGLWQRPVVSLLLELGLVLGGAALYYRTATRLPIPAGVPRSQQRRRVVVARSVTTLLLLLLLASDYLGL